jgi:hypothetical protein
MELLYPAIITAVLMYAWFETDAFVVYMAAFNLGWGMFKLAEFKEENKKVPSLDYHTFLLMRHSSSFFIKLITCPVCLIVWIAPLASLSYHGELALTVAFQEVFFSWVLFFSLKTLVNRSEA